MFSLLPLIALAAVASAAPLTRDGSQGFRRSPSGHIVGGENTTIEEVPYQISLRAYGGHYCGGSIISKHWIVTAAHCAGESMEQYEVHAGSTFASSGGSDHRVVDVIIHENYTENFYGIISGDIAVMRVAEPFVFDETRQPIVLFNENEETPAGKASTITGWGINGWGTTDGWRLPEILQTVSVPIITKSKCSRLYSVYGGLPAGQICAAYPEGGNDACQRGSGGPLAVDGRLAGVVSWGVGCALVGKPGLYTEVAAFRAWIKQQTGV